MFAKCIHASENESPFRRGSPYFPETTRRALDRDYFPAAWSSSPVTDSPAGCMLKRNETFPYESRVVTTRPATTSRSALRPRNRFNFPPRIDVAAEKPAGEAVVKPGDRSRFHGNDSIGKHVQARTSQRGNRGNRREEAPCWGKLRHGDWRISFLRHFSSAFSPAKGTANSSAWVTPVASEIYLFCKIGPVFPLPGDRIVIAR